MNRALLLSLELIEGLRISPRRQPPVALTSGPYKDIHFGQHTFSEPQSVLIKPASGRREEIGARLHELMGLSGVGVRVVDPHPEHPISREMGRTGPVSVQRMIPAKPLAGVPLHALSEPKQEQMIAHHLGRFMLGDSDGKGENYLHDEDHVYAIDHDATFSDFQGFDHPVRGKNSFEDDPHHMYLHKHLADFARRTNPESLARIERNVVDWAGDVQAIPDRHFTHVIGPGESSDVVGEVLRRKSAIQDHARDLFAQVRAMRA